tara:strand:- start:973 stop:2388 length:1416 start_codon:yes stop_codon:yes gene_type:complete
MNPRVRFAPSPTGEPHLGFARTALYNYLFARNKGGDFLLRIEDTDLERSKKEHIDQITNSMEWLGLKWDEEIVFQSGRKNSYEKYSKFLLDSGKAYRCFASKKQLGKIREETGSYHYNGMWRNRSNKEINRELEKATPFTIRLKTPNSGVVNFKDMIYGDIIVSNTEIDDFIIVRSDGSHVYNFTNVIDDQYMRINYVIRGEDHISNTPKQIQIYKAMEWDIPTFAHLPMILGDDKKRLSKRHGAKSVLSYREEGIQSEALLNYLALLGWNPGTSEEIMDLSRLVKKFNLNRVQKKSAIFDQQKLNWISSQHLGMQKDNEILKSIRVFNPDWGLDQSDDYCIKVINVMVPRSKSIRDLIEKSDYCFHAPKIFSDDHIRKIWEKSTQSIIEELIEIFIKESDWEKDTIEKIVKNYIERTECSFAQVMKPMRLALCGSLGGPSLFIFMELLGKNHSIDRLKSAIKNIKLNEKE